MMSDLKPAHPTGAVLQYPDKSTYVYMQASQELTQGTYVEVNPLHRIKKFTGGLRFPQGIVLETVPKEGWTFVMVSPAQQAPPQVQLVTPNGKEVDVPGEELTKIVGSSSE